MISKATARARADAGAAWLTKELAVTDWFAQIDLDELDQGEASRCVHGQIFGEDPYRWDSRPSDVARGFDLTWDDVRVSEDERDWDRGFAILTEVWRELIEERIQA
jgi:hypothetical protein